MQSAPETDKRLFLLDAYALIYRSYFAFIKNPRVNSGGLNTSAMFGFTNTLEQLLSKERPTHVAVVFDVYEPTFRHELYPAYKATREVMPEDLQKAIPWIKKIVEAYRIPVLEKAGFEADDVIGTLAVKAEQRDYRVYMMTPDKDYAQLVTDSILMYKPGRGGNEMELWGTEEVRANFGIREPAQVIEILGLTGDASDNVPGCPGIGPKTAMKLIGDYHSIDGLYEHIDELKGKQKENLLQYEKQVRLSRKLVTIVTDVPVDFDEAALSLGDPDTNRLRDLFAELEFRSLAQKYGSPQPSAGLKPSQGTLFDNRQQPGREEPMFEQGTLFAQEQVAPPAPPVKVLADATSTPHTYWLVNTDMQRASRRADL